MCGVVDVTVDLVTAHATIKYTPGLTGPRDLLAVISDAGFEAALPHDKDSSTQDILAREAGAWRWRLLLSVLCAVPVAILSMLPMIPALSNWEHPKVVGGLPMTWLVQLVLASVVQGYVGWTFYRAAYHGLMYRNANMSLLVVLGTTAAYVYSVMAIILSAMVEHYMGHVYFETSALIITFVCAGKYIQAHAKTRTSNVVASLLGLQAKTAVLLKLGQDGVTVVAEEVIAAELIQVGDVLRVRPGTTVPADGAVLLGQSCVNESMITGESMPVSKAPGDEVIGGTVNQEGVLDIKATRVGHETTVSHIARLVQESQANKAPIQVGKFGSTYIQLS